MALNIFLLILFFSSITVQLVYLLIFGYKFKSYVKPQNTTIQPVSVVVCARNEQENLKKLIPLLLDQQHPEFEVVLVNDRSTDDTVDWFRENYASQEGIKIIQVDYKPEHLDGKKYAITLGIKGAQHDHILFTDADCRPKSDQWLTAMSAGFDTKKKVVLGYSGYEQLPGFLNYFIRFETLWTAIQYLGLAMTRFPYMGVGRNMGYSKKLFLKNKGFHGYQNVTGGDDDLFINKNAHAENTSVVIGYEATICSIPKTTYKAFFKQKLRHLSVGRHYSGKSKTILSLFSISHLLSWVLLISLGMLRIELSLIIGGFLVRTLVLHVTFMLACKALGEQFKIAGLLILECSFAIYYSLVGITALCTKKVRWI
ncbi:glycosyltransferase [Fulvivirga sp. M361]|uniref:glycosyltransferase n=1 Tax=Fulvivirga sp. M361 TaxID=2594266 RepID=UPI00210529F8|nr:glycosyltransferase [Fulvivirga sp. M361]